MHIFGKGVNLVDLNIPADEGLNEGDFGLKGKAK